MLTRMMNPIESGICRYERSEVKECLSSSLSDLQLSQYLQLSSLRTETRGRSNLKDKVPLQRGVYLFVHARYDKRCVSFVFI